MAQRTTLKKQILLGYLAPAAVVILVCLAVFLKAREVQRAYDNVADGQEVVLASKDLAIEFQSMQRAARGYIIYKNEVSKRSFENARVGYTVKRELLLRLVKDTQQLETMRRIDVAKDELQKSIDEEVTLVDAGQSEKAIEQMRNGRAIQIATEISDLLKKFDLREQDILVQRATVHADGLKALVYLVLASTVLSVLAAAGFAVILANRIGRMVGESISTMTTSTAQIAASVEEHERTVSQQAGSVSETTTTVEELGVSSRQSAGQAESTAIAAKQAFDAARDGTQQANRAVTSMRLMKEKVGSVAEQILRLSDQAAQIGSIAKMVGELAGETNMLALNAAVEAARAGDHGRGFAVVASEVRKLADQTRKSAERANGLVADIQKATNAAVMVTEDGNRTADEVSRNAESVLESFASITNAANRVADNAQQVVLNSKQQAIALEQVTVAMKSLTAGSLQITAGTRQTQLGIGKLAEVATDLQSML